MKIKLAEALLRRKQLQEKVNILKNFKDHQAIYQVHPKRIRIDESLDEVQGLYPKLDVSQVTSEYDHYAQALRLIDATIQQANWTCDIDVNDVAMKEFSQR